jgi:DivIVA domain-containing protein
MQEITEPLATLPDNPVPAVADVEFPTALRGYDRLAVDAYVQRTSQLVAELQATRSPDAAIRRALERVGEEVSGILQRAHEAAGQITFQSRSEAEDRLETARQEAAQIVAAAEERVRELDAETDRIWAERHRIVEDTRELARDLLSITDGAAERFPAEAVPLEPEGDVTAPAGPVAREDEADVEAENIVEAEDIFAEGPDPHVEPTAVLPVVEAGPADEEPQPEHEPESESESESH